MFWHPDGEQLHFTAFFFFWSCKNPRMVPCNDCIFLGGEGRGGEGKGKGTSGPFLIIAFLGLIYESFLHLGPVWLTFTGVLGGGFGIVLLTSRSGRRVLGLFCFVFLSVFLCFSVSLSVCLLIYSHRMQINRLDYDDDDSGGGEVKRGKGLCPFPPRFFFAVLLLLCICTFCVDVHK